MARQHGLAILPWGTLEGGVLTGKHTQASDEPRREANPSERERAAGEAVLKIAQEVTRSPAQVALNWVRQKPGNVIPILGARRLPQIHDNVGCLEFQLSEGHMAELDNVADFKPGFPNAFLLGNHVRELIFGDTFTRLETYF
jgi:aryl-alcohol dehydrogenase-like predicted oxidoreductase